VLHYRARGQQAWDTRTVLVPPVDRAPTEKVRQRDGDGEGGTER
jgi:hypothetical protein